MFNDNLSFGHKKKIIASVILRLMDVNFEQLISWQFSDGVKAIGCNGSTSFEMWFQSKLRC